MQKQPPLYLLLCILFTSLILSACSSFQNRSTNTEKTEELPTPIALPTQLGVQNRVEIQTCQVVQKAIIQTDKVQGDLMAWSPNSDQLAFIQPVNQYAGWYIGDLLIFDADAAKEVFTSEDSTVFGDVTWSPDGNSIAYIVLDQDEGIYTIKLLTLADGLTADIFGDIETARTNEFASLKGILKWSSDSSLTVTSNCGSDCVHVYEYNPISASLTIQEDIRVKDDSSLGLVNEMKSPDGKWQLTTDDNDNLWLTDIMTNQVSLLLTATQTAEVKWSKDSTYLATRSADLVTIFKVGCTPK